MADDALTASRDAIVVGVKKVFGQDAPVIAGVQARAGVRDDLGIRTRFSPFWETAVHGFQKRVVDSMLS